MKKILFYFSLAMLVATLSLQAFPPDFDFEKGSQKGLNKWVALTGAKLYDQLNNNKKFGYPAGNKTSDCYTKSEHWLSISAFLSQMGDLEKKKGVSASVALIDLLESEGRFDCRIAQKIVFLECIRRLIGNKHFDSLCAELEKEKSKDLFRPGTRKLWIGGGESRNPFFRLTSEKTGALCSQEVGCFGYILNVPEYPQLHPQGNLRGDNGLVCPPDL